MDWILGFFLGLGLAAAAGFRVFVPLFLVSLSAHTGHLDLADRFAWIGSLPALITFGAATLFEIGAYYIPFLDNLLDTIAVPAAAVGGTLLMATALFDADPLIRWTVALIAGGGTAATIKGAASGIRLGSTATTGGLANPLVSTSETAGSFGLGILSLALPWLAGLLALALLVFLVRKAGTLRRRFDRNHRSASD